MIIVLSRAFFAARDTWIPVGAALVSVVVAVGTAALLIGPLGILGLALGVAVASWVEAILLLAGVPLPARRRSGCCAWGAPTSGTWRRGRRRTRRRPGLRSRRRRAAAGSRPAIERRAGAGLRRGSRPGRLRRPRALLRVPELRGAIVRLVRAGLRRTRRHEPTGTRWLPLGDAAAWDAFVEGDRARVVPPARRLGAGQGAERLDSRADVIGRRRRAARIGAQVLLRRPRPLPWAFAYAPRGPGGRGVDGAGDRRA